VISVRVNGKPVDLSGPTPLLDYVRQLGVDPRAIAVEVNGEILQRETYADCVLEEGDAVEIVRMVGGGREGETPGRPAAGATPASHSSGVATALSFVDCINRGDVDGLGRLMTGDHALQVFDEAPLVGRDANIEAWRGYAAAFPDYRIYPQSTSDASGLVAILGHTTGSHLGLPDDQERQLTLIWLAEVTQGTVRSWTLVEDTPDNRTRHGLSRR
jgi:thiamine biosynthesis protein ThiS